ncbi:MAG: RDD family protein [Phycisphaerales bacterium]|nr:RDD family protein [Phycisphaerales bacterium]
MSLLLVALFAVVPGLRAQNAEQGHAEAEAPSGSSIFVSATGKTLWVGESRANRSQILWRQAVTDFDVLRPIRIAGEIAHIEALDESVFVQLETGLYEYDRSDLTDVPSTISNLPGDAQPLALATGDGTLYAVVSGDVARQIRPNADAPALPSDAPSVNLDGADYVVVRYRGERWQPFTALPTSGSGPPAICLVDSRLVLAWRQDETIHTAEITFEHDQPIRTRSQPVQVNGIEKWWLTAVGGVPTLVTVRTSESDKPIAFRWLGAPDERKWSPVSLTLSELPEGVADATVEFAVGFNQQIALLLRTSDAAPVLRYAGLGIPPTLKSERLDETLRGPAAAMRVDEVVQAATWIILIAIIVSITFFRRGAITRDAVLPAGVAHALLFQRAIAALIDMAPIAIGLAALVGVDWRQGLALLAQWGVFAQPEAMRDADLLKWWALTSLTYVGYACVMEMTVGRTIGKFAMRIRVISDTGEKPRPWQMFARNAFRLIELMPQFWILYLMVALARNRQRIGDVFARTVVVRRFEMSPPEEIEDTDEDSESGEDED